MKEDILVCFELKYRKGWQKWDTVPSVPGFSVSAESTTSYRLTSRHPARLPAASSLKPWLPRFHVLWATLCWGSTPSKTEAKSETSQSITYRTPGPPAQQEEEDAPVQARLDVCLASKTVSGKRNTYPKLELEFISGTLWKKRTALLREQDSLNE